MGQESELQRLERFVAKLLTSFSDLRAEKAALMQQLAERNRQIEELYNQLATEEAERGEIGQRVGKLVEQIEEWEKSLDQAAEAAEPPAPVEELSEEAEEPDLDEYEVQEEIVELDHARGEEEARIQHNLFSLNGVQR